MSNILTFNEFISEGLFAKTILRNNSGNKRREDTNLYNLKPIDLGLPFLIANDDLEIDGLERFNYAQVEEYRKLIESQGWRIPTKEDLKPFVDTDDTPIKYKVIDIGKISMYTDKTNNEVFFTSDLSSKNSFDENYWLIDSPIYNGGKVNRTFLSSWRISNNSDPKHILKSLFCMSEKQNRYFIRLIKDK